MKSLLLIDNRVNDTSTVIQSLNDNTNYIIIDYDNDTYDTIVGKIGNNTTYNNIGIFQENYDLDSYQLVNSFEKSVLENVEEIDNNLQSWHQFKQLFSYFKNVLLASKIDLMGCNIHSNINWNFVIQKIQIEIGIQINSSNDNTGNAVLDGNWILESNNENLIGLYFTENIKTYNFILGYTNNHSVFLMNNGTVYTCGLNNYGQLGDGTNTARYYPAPVKININNVITDLSNIVQVSAGESHTVYLSNNGKVYASGYNTYRQLGDRTTISRVNPILVKSNINSDLLNITQVSAGRVHTIFLSNDGFVYAIGNSSTGQLGYGSSQTPVYPVKVKTNINNVITDLSNIIQVSAGFSHSLFLKSDGTVYACGRNLRGELGNGTTTMTLYAVLITSLTNIAQVSAGYYNSLFLKMDGTVLSCGLNEYGQLGNNSINQSLSPVNVIGLTNIIQVSSGFAQSIFLKSDGTVYACGLNNYRQLGDGSSTNKIIPVPVVENSNTNLTNITQINTGNYFSLFLTNSKNTYAIGKYDNGQLGNGTITSLYPYVNFVKNNNTIQDTSQILFNNNLNYVYSIDDYNKKYNLLKNTIGFTNENINYTINDLLIYGLSVSTLKTSQYNFTDSDILNSTNVPIFNRSWFQTNYTIQQIIAVYTAYQLYNSGYSILEIYNYYVTYNYAAEKTCYDSGFKLSFLLSSIPNYTLTRLLQQHQNSFILTLLGITNPPTNNFIYIVQDLLTSNNKVDRKLAIPDFVNGGVIIKYLYNNGVPITDLLKHYTVIYLLTSNNGEDGKLTVQDFLDSRYSVDSDYDVYFLIQNLVKFRYLYDNGVTITTLLSIQNILNPPNDYNVVDLLTSNNGEDGKLTITDFFNNEFTIEYLVDNNVKFKYLYDNGVTIDTLINIYNTTQIITTNNGNDGKFTIRELILYMVTFKRLVEDGVTVPVLLASPNSFIIPDLLTSNNGEDGKLSIPELLLYGATFQILLSGGISVSTLRTYYILNNLITSNNGNDGKLTVRQLLTTNLGQDGKFLVEDFLNNVPNFSLTYLHDRGISFVELIQNLITVTELKTEFLLTQLITTNNRIDGGLTYIDLYNNGNGVTFPEFFEIRITINNLLYPNNSSDGGFTIEQLVNDINGDITFQLLFNNDVSIETLLLHYNVLHLLNANNGLNIQNFIDNNYTLPFLVDNGVTFKRLNENGITIPTLLNYFNITELITTNNGLDGKFNIKELIQNYNVNINLLINNNIVTILDLLGPPYNFSIQYLLGKGISLKRMNEAGVSISTLLLHFSLQKLLDDGISIFTLLDNNITFTYLIANNISLKKIYDYGVQISTLLAYPFSIQQLLEGGLTIDDFIKDGYYELLQQSGIDIFLYDDSITVASLLKIGFTKEYIYNIRKNQDRKYSIFQLIEGGFTKFDLNPKGIYFLTPKNSYELRVSLNSDFSDIRINQDLIINFNNLTNGNNNAKFLKNYSNKNVKITYNN